MPEPTKDEVIARRREAKINKLVDAFRESGVTAIDAFLGMTNPDWLAELSNRLGINPPSPLTRRLVAQRLRELERNKS